MENHNLAFALVEMCLFWGKKHNSRFVGPADGNLSELNQVVVVFFLTFVKKIMHILNREVSQVQ